MAARTLGTIAAIGILTAIPARADAIAGDIVDQILQSQSPPPPIAPAPVPTPVIPPVASPAPAGPVAIAPSYAAPTSITSIAGPTTLDSPDIVDQALQTAAPSAAASGPAATSAPPPAPEPAKIVDTTPWTGIFLGANLGGGWTHGGSGVNCFNTATQSTSGCAIIGDSALSTSGVIGGGGVGYSRPLVLGPGSSVIIGAEIDVEGAGISGSQNVAGPFHLVGFPDTCSPCSFSASQKINWFGTLRAKIGVPLDRFLIYATGGLMVGGVQVSQNLSFTGTGQGEAVSARSTLSGPTVGGGVEMLLGSGWSAKLEGLYYDMGTLNTIAASYGAAPTNFNNSKSFGFRGAMIRLGVNLRLGDLGVF
jgi:outer membrane immunogenic protein